jgi:hypothetical protein
MRARKLSEMAVRSLLRCSYPGGEVRGLVTIPSECKLGICHVLDAEQQLFRLSNA